MQRIAITMLMLACALPGLAQESPLKGLEPHIGKDLQKLDADALAEFRKQVDAITRDKSKTNEWGSYKPWWVMPFVRTNAAWVLLEAYPGYDVPDISHVRIHVFDRNWMRIAKHSFPTGYRCFLKEVVLVKDNPLKQDLLVAKVTSTGPFILQGDEQRPAFEQGDYQCQYYALLGDQFVMVRLEDNNNTIARNHYRWQAPPKGPPVPKHTADEWIRSLSSANSVEQLTTLVWLSGTHLDSTEKRKKDHNQESVEDSELFEAVFDAAETKNALQELVKSKNTWVQEYATLTLRLIRE